MIASAEMKRGFQQLRNIVLVMVIIASFFCTSQGKDSFVPLCTILGLKENSNTAISFWMVTKTLYYFVSKLAGLNRNLLEGVSSGNFEKDESSYLNITSIVSQLIEDTIECGFACLEISSCFSYNLAAFPDVNRKLLCELLPSDKYNNSDKFNTSKLFHHFSIPVSKTSSKTGGALLIFCYGSFMQLIITDFRTNKKLCWLKWTSETPRRGYTKTLSLS